MINMTEWKKWADKTVICPYCKEERKIHQHIHRIIDNRLLILCRKCWNEFEVLNFTGE
jgi:hypothetical protein